MNEGDWDKIRTIVHDSIQEAIEGERKIMATAIETHARSDDHIALRAFVVRNERQQEMWDKIITSVVGAIVIGSLYWVGSYAIEAARWLISGR